MKKIFFIILFLPLLSLKAQKLGEMAPEKPLEKFPRNSWGVDFMFGEGGFGLGTFYRHDLNNTLTGFVDFSMSEAKDDQEIEYYDYYTQQYVTVNKKNRVFLLPLNFGLQQRLFENSITENLRPYVNFGVGPTLVLTTPYEKEFFSSFGSAQAKYTAGGYVGLGANFGLDKSSLLGINLRYYVIHFFNNGVESLDGKFQKNLGGFYLTINLGIMY
ncbi:MAG: hypothetical protein HF308_15435 [Ignavibacteria bacterium]|jgi:hypothetical protein|nr:hypothetical protein [Ignavibacteria bacterium]MCU7522487.1 hypothetical protein [Ignavibacteria bacterium]MCU7525871.1 hypothetical protein [Ignavibacteria bacterium]